MPHEAIGMGKIIQLLQAHVAGDRCPGSAEHTASCVLDWKATVTFDRIAQRVLGPGEGGQPPGGGGSDLDDTSSMTSRSRRAPSPGRMTVSSTPPPATSPRRGAP
jgi:hypothetical protein